MKLIMLTWNIKKNKTILINFYLKKISNWYETLKTLSCIFAKLQIIQVVHLFQSAAGNTLDFSNWSRCDPTANHHRIPTYAQSQTWYTYDTAMENSTESTVCAIKH